MSFGQNLVNDADTLLDGTWTYDNTEYELRCRNISYKDLRRVQQYGALAASVSAVGEGVEDGGEIGEAELEAINQQADNLDNFSWEETEGDGDWVASVVEEKLVKPDVDIEQTSAPKLRALVEGMMDAWGESTKVQNAKDEMPVEGGN
jgi:hypothetical protein